MSPNHELLDSNQFRLEVSGVDGIEAEQERADFCWAAAIQTVLAFHGVEVEQCEAVRAVFGDCDKNRAHSASLGQIVCALNGWHPNTVGRPAALTATPFGSNANSILAELANNRPVVIGLRKHGSKIGHVCILMAAEYSYDPRGYACYHAVDVFDPLPSEGDKTLTGAELAQLLDFAVVVWVTHF
jgi:hypothetical protein